MISTSLALAKFGRKTDFQRSQSTKERKREELSFSWKLQQREKERETLGGERKREGKWG